VVAGLVFGSLALIYAQVFSYEPVGPEVVTEASFSVSAASAPTATSDAYVIFDTATGEVLVSKGIDEVHPIASVTKLFAAVALFEAFDPESTTTITWADVAGEGEAGKLHPTEVYSYRELLFPLLLESSNDAALALEHATKGEIIGSMQAVAVKYGAVSTSFADASGLSARNVSTAGDLMRFVRATNSIYPFVYDIGQLPQYIGTYTGWQNNNPVAVTPDFRGGKHGYTEAAGRTLVAQFEEPFTAGNRTIGYVILGSSDLKADTAMLRAFTRDSVDYQ
jgi:D-alanyl-D-alanine carboxypeptidase